MVKRKKANYIMIDVNAMSINHLTIYYHRIFTNIIWRNKAECYDYPYGKK